MTVRSNFLAGGVESGGPNTRYTVPTGYRTIVKCISAQNTFAGFNRFYFEVYDGATIGYVILPLGTGGGLDEAKTVECFHVLQAGWEIRTDALHASINYLISGAELAL